MSLVNSKDYIHRQISKKKKKERNKMALPETKPAMLACKVSAKTTGISNIPSTASIMNDFIHGL